MSPDSQTEIQAEQAVVDHAYRRLEAMRAEARALASDVLDQGAGGTFANRIERDVRIEVTGRRLADLQVGEAGLVFGRIDPHHGDHLYIGRLAVADEDNEPLVVDWRARPMAWRAASRPPRARCPRRPLRAGRCGGGRPRGGRCARTRARPRPPADRRAAGR